MAQTIILNRSAVAGKLPTFADLKLGEIAINTYDGKIFLKKDDGSESIVEFNGNVDVPVPAGAINAVQLNAGNGSLEAVSMGTAGHVLTSNGVDAPTWEPTTIGTVTSVDATGGTTGMTFTGGPITTAGSLTLGGTLAIANGGTGVTTQAALQEVALPAQVENAGKILSTDGSVASWIDVPVAGGTVTSINVSGGTTGLTTSGGPITDAGTITLSGMLGVTNGGTGATTAANALNNISPATTAGDLIVRGSSEHSRIPIGNVGEVLTVSGASTVGWRPAGGAMYIPVVENDIHAIPEGVTNVHLYRPQGGTDVNTCSIQFPPNAVDNQPFSLYFGMEINVLQLTPMGVGVTITEQPSYVRDGETARWLYNAATSQWLCIENPRHMFVVTQGNIGTTGSDMILDVNNIRFTLKYRTGTSTQATAQTITGSEMIDLRWVSIYNGAIDASSYDGYTLTTTPVVVDSIIYDASNELPHIHLRENNRIWRIHFFASANGARTTFWAKRVV